MLYKKSSFTVPAIGEGKREGVCRHEWIGFVRGKPRCIPCGITIPPCWGCDCDEGGFHGYRCEENRKAHEEDGREYCGECYYHNNHHADCSKGEGSFREGVLWDADKGMFVEGAVWEAGE